ncbi:phage portal protein [Nitrobacter sp. TKz-YC01]|uniref:portal protein n=1 Tax=Nitrobacter sp. TKz-YC01 TaxID=3398703 RepID=UPI003A0FC3B9
MTDDIDERPAVNEEGAKIGSADLDGLFDRLKGWCCEDLSKTAKWRSDAREDYAFEAGDQWSEEDKGVLRDQLRPVITMNRVGSIIDSVSGSEISNRQEVQYIPRTQGDVQVNEIFTSAAKWFRDECDAEDEESDAFRDVLICGMGWTETRLDYEDNPDGDPRIDRIDPLEMVWDSAAKKKNIIDGRRVFHIRRDIPIEEARALCPNDDFEDADYNATWVNDEIDKKDIDENDGRFYDKPDQSAEEDSQKGDKRVTLVRAQWYEREPAFRIINPDDPGQIVTVGKKQHDAIQNAARNAGIPPLKSVRITRKVFKQAYLGRVLLEVSEAPCKDRFSFNCMTGKRDRNKNTFYGLVRSMKDPQRWANKWLSQTLHIMNSTAKGGIVAERGVFDNDAEAEESWAKQDAITWLKKGALQEGRWKEKPQAQFPVGFYQLTEMAISSIRDVTGVNVEVLGMREATQAASLEAQRKQSAMVILQPMFDSLRRYRKNQGRTLLYLIQNYLSDGRLIRIVGEEGEQYVPLTRQPQVETYDVIVDQSPTSPDQKQAIWGMLQQILPAIGKIIPPEVYMALLKYSPLPTSVQKDIEKGVEASQQSQQGQPSAEEQKAQNDIKIEDMKVQAEIERLNRKTEAEIKAMERKADVQEKIAQRKAMADAMSKAAPPAGPAVDENGMPVAGQPDQSTAVLVTLMSELTQALKALSAPKQIVYGPNGEPVGVKPMVA